MPVDAIRRRPRAVVTGLLAALAAVLVWTISTTVFPYYSLNHDEAVYLQQAAMLLDGQLFLHPPVPEVFRPWFFVADGTRLYAKYTPVTAAVFALGSLAGSPRFALVAVAAANVALVTLVVSEVFDGRTGLLAAALVLASPLFLIQSSVFLSYAPTTMFSLLFAYGYLRADRIGDHRWTAVAGAAVGIAFFSRPYTAVLFAVPFVAHAAWTLWHERWDVLPRLAATAGFGLVGVGATLVYNATVTGDPLLFPYEAFAPLDGLGLGHREILAHDVDYTLSLALRSNALVLDAFVTRWVAGGIIGTVFALGGLATALRRGLDAREATLAGLFVTVPVGNLFFWGNFNVLGDLDRAGDGLIGTHGPYYHFDLLVPVAAFAAVGVIALYHRVEGRLADRMTRQRARAGAIVLLLMIAGPAAGLTAVAAEWPLDRNTAATDTYERAYEPFEPEPPTDAVVLLPDPYGDWLNHPFQPLRNDPGFDGPTVYALHERPFALVDRYPDRSYYRYVYRGSWDPEAGSPRAAWLQPVSHVTGDRVAANVTVGVPEFARSVTATLTTPDGTVRRTAVASSGTLAAELIANGSDAWLQGPGWNATAPVSLADADEVDLTLFVDTGPGVSFSYRFEMPIETDGATVRVLTPRIERCTAIAECGGEAGYVPEHAPPGYAAETDLSVLRASG